MTEQDRVRHEAIQDRAVALGCVPPDLMDTDDDDLETAEVEERLLVAIRTKLGRRKPEPAPEPRRPRRSYYRKAHMPAEPGRYGTVQVLVVAKAYSRPEGEKDDTDWSDPELEVRWEIGYSYRSPLDVDRRAEGMKYARERLGAAVLPGVLGEPPLEEAISYAILVAQDAPPWLGGHRTRHGVFPLAVAQVLRKRDPEAVRREFHSLDVRSA